MAGKKGSKWYLRIKLICERCGQEFEIFPCQLYHPVTGHRRRFCGEACKNMAFNKEKWPERDWSFLNTWTPTIAYIIGLLAADGWVSGPQLGFSSIDKELTSAFCDIFAPNSEPSIHKPKKPTHHTAYRKCVHSQELIERLIPLGIVECKSAILTMPDVPVVLMPFYLRGYFEGDGGCSFAPASFLVMLTSGSAPFLTTIQNYLAPLKIRSHLHKLSSHRNTYQLKLSGRYALHFGLILYNDLETVSYYCYRKYQAIQDALERYPRSSRLARRAFTSP